MLNRKETILRIRNAEMNDVAALSELMGELGYPTTEKTDDHPFDEYSTRFELSHICSGGKSRNCRDDWFF